MKQIDASYYRANILLITKLVFSQLSENIRAENLSSKSNVSWIVHKKVLDENNDLKKRIIMEANELNQIRAQNLQLVNKMVNGFDKVMGIETVPFKFSKIFFKMSLLFLLFSLVVLLRYLLIFFYRNN